MLLAIDITKEILLSDGEGIISFHAVMLFLVKLSTIKFFVR